MTATALTLALTLAHERMERVARTVRRARDTFDHDEDSWGTFTLEHDPWCPIRLTPKRDGVCACGLDRALEELRNACMDADAVLETLARCIAEGK